MLGKRDAAALLVHEGPRKFIKRLPPSDSEDANNYDNSGTTPSSPVVYDLCDSEEAEEEELAEVLSDADTLPWL